MVVKVSSHEDLEVWQLSIKLVTDIYQITEQFPAKERYRLIDQICRAVVSIPANIAEGSARKSTREFIRFLAIALGSLAELRTYLVIAKDLNYLSFAQCDMLNPKVALLGKKMHALYRALENKND